MEPRPVPLVVVFSSRLRPDLSPEEAGAYAATAARMEALAARQPGFLGVESARSSDGLGVTVSTWSDARALAAWRDHPEHAAARRLGRERWYASWRLRVATVASDRGSTAAEQAEAGPAAGAGADA